MLLMIVDWMLIVFCTNRLVLLGRLVVILGMVGVICFGLIMLRLVMNLARMRSRFVRFYVVVGANVRFCIVFLSVNVFWLCI